MDHTTVLELDKPVGTESFARSTINGNMDTIDKLAIIAYVFGDVPYPGLSKGAVSYTGGKPSSQDISGPNGLAGTTSWVFTSTTATQTLSITAPTAWSVTKTTTISDQSEICE